MNKWLEILFGLLLILIAVFIGVTYASWGAAAIVLLKGGIIWGIGLIGLIFLILGITDLKN